MAEPEDPRLRVLEQAQRAAAAFAQGRDGLALVPFEIRAQVVEWKRRLDALGQRLDEEGWLIGLLTLACLTHGRATVETGSA